MSAQLEVSILQKEIGQLKERVAKLERTVTFLLGHTNAIYVDHPEENPFDDVIALVHTGDKMGAIKRYREKTGASLAQAQQFVNSL